MNKKLTTLSLIAVLLVMVISLWKTNFADLVGNVEPPTNPKNIQLDGHAQLTENGDVSNKPDNTYKPSKLNQISKANSPQLTPTTTAPPYEVRCAQVQQWYESLGTGLVNFFPTFPTQLHPYTRKDDAELLILADDMDAAAEFELGKRQLYTLLEKVKTKTSNFDSVNEISQAFAEPRERLMRAVVGGQVMALLEVAFSYGFESFAYEQSGLLTPELKKQLWLASYRHGNAIEELAEGMDKALYNAGYPDEQEVLDRMVNETVKEIQDLRVKAGLRPYSLKVPEAYQTVTSEECKRFDLVATASKALAIRPSPLNSTSSIVQFITTTRPRRIWASH